MSNVTLDYIFGTNLKIYQDSRFFKFSLDSILLANYINLRNNINILDLGTGNGVIPLVLASKNESVLIDGVEIQSGVSTLAKRSVLHNGFEKRVKIIEMDLREIDNLYERESFDIVVSNPPYFSKNNGQPSETDSYAFARHELNGSIKDFIVTASNMLKYRGSAYFVYNSDRLSEFLSLLSMNKLEPKKLKFIHARKNIKSNIFLVKATKGANQGLIVEPSLSVYEKQNYTKDLLNIVNIGDYN